MKNEINNESILWLFQGALDKKLTSNVSRHHKNNLRYLYNHCMRFSGEAGQNMSIRELTMAKIEDFLLQYNSSATHYMNKRRDLNVLINLSGKMIDDTLPAGKSTETRRIKATLNEAFATDLDAFIDDRGADYWIYGHHHDTTGDFNIGKTKLVTNQLGYVHHDEYREFDTGRAVSFD